MRLSARKENKMIDKDSNEVFDIECRKCTQCGAWYATCRANRLGKATQWGTTEMEAIKNLQKYIVDIWQEKWPEVKPAT